VNTLNVNKIYYGDSLFLLADSNVFPDDSIDLIFTSPPYADKRITSYGGVHPNKYVSWFIPIAAHLKRILKPRGSFILNIKEHPLEGERQTYVIELILELKKQGWLWIEEYCWYKKNCFPGKWPNRFRDAWERCLHFTKRSDFSMYQDAVRVPIGDWSTKRFKSMSEQDYIRYISKNNKHMTRNVSNWLGKKTVNPHNVLVFEEEHFLYPSNVIESATQCSNRNHSAPFPLELPSWFMRLFTEENQVVLDPFLGSGTTAAAAILLNRKYIGVEIIPEYRTQIENCISEVESLKNGRKHYLIR